MVFSLLLSYETTMDLNVCIHDKLINEQFPIFTNFFTKDFPGKSDEFRNERAASSLLYFETKLGQ